MRTSAYLAWLLAAASAWALDAGVACAQTAAAPASASDQTLPVVVVTAERHSQDLQRAATSVSVRSGEALLAQGKYSLSSILEDVPGVSGGAAVTTAGAGQSPTGTDSPAAGLTIRGKIGRASC